MASEELVQPINPEATERNIQDSPRKTSRREFLVEAAALGGAAVLSAAAQACRIPEASESPPPKRAPTPNSEPPTPTPEGTPEPSEVGRLKADVETLATNLKKTEKLLYGVEALEIGEISEFRGRMMWDKENETDENKKWHEDEYQGFREKLKEEKEKWEVLQANEVQMQALDEEQKGVVARAVGEIKETEEQFDEWKRSKRWTEVELGQKLHWLRFRQREMELIADLNKKQNQFNNSEIQETPDWGLVNRLYRDANLPVTSEARFIPADEVEAEDEQVEATEACQETMLVLGISNDPDIKGSKTLVHLTPRKTSDGKAVLGNTAFKGSWAAGVEWWVGDEKKSYVEPRKTSEKSTFDNTGVVVSYQGNECLVNIACVVEEIDGKERSFVKAYFVDKQTGSKVGNTQILDEVDLGDFDDFTGSAQLNTVGGKIVANWTHVGAQGFNIRGVEWNASKEEFEEIDGYLNHTDHRACQFGRAVAYNPSNGKYSITYAFYNGNGNISAVAHEARLADYQKQLESLKRITLDFSN